MVDHYEDKGKVFTQVINKLPVQVIIQTRDHQIHGTFHVRPNTRIKDEINLSESFIAVTDAVIRSLDGQAEIYRVGFMLVQKNEMIWLFPVEEIVSAEQLS